MFKSTKFTKFSLVQHAGVAFNIVRKTKIRKACSKK